MATAQRKILLDSEINQSHADCGKVQDAYSLRCIPQVLGASLDTIRYVYSVLETEINSATDNPLVFGDDGTVLSGGNFHGQPVALAMDFLGIAVSEIASISERRVNRLINPHLSELPAFLTTEGGLESGMMMAQYTAAALVSEKKVIAHPARYNMTRTKLRKLLNEFRELGGAAIEVVSGSHSKDECFTMARHANDLGLHASAGSDFHSPDNAWIELGRLMPLPVGCKPVWELLQA